MKNTVVGLGEILWDVFPERKVLGGAPANFAYHVSQFGFNGYAVSAIGGDLLGKEILKSLEEKELNYIIEKTDFPTGTVKVQLDGRGVPTYEISENVAWDNIPFSSRIENLAKNTNTVCFGSLAQRSIARYYPQVLRFDASRESQSIRYQPPLEILQQRGNRRFFRQGNCFKNQR